MDDKTYNRDPKDFTNKLWSLKNRGKFCDSTVIIDKKSIPVHSVVLASCSDFFESAFDNVGNEGKELILNSFDVEILESLIEYCYTGSIKINEDKALEIFEIANILSMPKIAEISSKILEKKINIKNCLSMWKLVQPENEKYLKNTVTSFICTYFEEISILPEFLALKYSDIKNMLSLDLTMESEMIIYNAIKKWVNHDKSRMNKTMDLLGYVKLEYLPHDFLLSEALSLCGSNNSCFSMFIEKALQSRKNNIPEKCTDSQNTLIAIGSDGYDTANIMEVLDLNENNWITIQHNGYQRATFATEKIKNKLMIIGGISKSGDATNFAEYYDMTTGKIESLPPMKYARYHLSAVRYNKIILAIGGLSGPNNNSNNYVSQIEKWDSVSKTWGEVSSKKISRYGLLTLVLGEEILLIGGYGLNEGYLSKTDAYNPTTDQWRSCSPMKETRYYPGVALVGGFVYAVGGEIPGQSMITAERYDPKIDQWSLIQSLRVATRMIGAGNLNGKLIISGGFTITTVSTVEMYDEKNLKWIPMESLKMARSKHRLIEIPWWLAKNILSKKTNEKI